MSEDWFCTKCGSQVMRMIRSEDPADKKIYVRCADCGGSSWQGPAARHLAAWQDNFEGVQ